MAAKTLVDKGIRVQLLDAGVLPNAFSEKTDESFATLRQTNPKQADYLLGSVFESLGSLQRKNPVHLTPQRLFTTAEVDKYLVWQDGDFNPIESLAKGGLGNAWGLGSYVYSAAELEQSGLPVALMQKAYQWVANCISISGGNDQSAAFANQSLFNPEMPIPLDFNGQRLWDKALKHQTCLNQKGFTVGRAPLALSTETTKNGERYKHNDLDFYETGITSAFRPINLIEQLEKTGLLLYTPQQLLLSFHQKDEFIDLESLDLKDGSKKHYRCKKLILAAGALGTARVVMRALNLDKLPLLCNPYTYIPSVQPRLLGAANMGYQTGLAQLSLYYDAAQTHQNIAMGSVYSYRSLMGFRLMREFPLNFKLGMQWLKLLQPALNITGVFHPEYAGPNKWMQRLPDRQQLSGDVFKSCYQLSSNEWHRISQTEQAFKTALRKLGTYPLKTQRNPHGASIHYGGTLPFSDTLGSSLGIRSNGRLHHFTNVFVADGSGFRFLSGKGLTLSLMAYAHCVANHASDN